MGAFYNNWLISENRQGRQTGSGPGVAKLPGQAKAAALKCCGAAALTLALALAQDARAEKPGEKNSFDSADMTLVAQGNLDYTACLRSRALEEMDSSPDVRVVADAAAAACRPVLDELRAALMDNRVNPQFANGAIERVKRRALRRLLPLLMMERSQRSSP